MNLFEDLAKVYDYNENIAGNVVDNNVVLYPLFHCGLNSQVTITIDMNGLFIKANINPIDKEFTVIPATLNSSCRSSNTAPHAINDRIDYVSGDMADYFDLNEKEIKRNKSRHNAYVDFLEKWAESPYATPKVQAIFDYISKNTLIKNLVTSGIIEMQGENVNIKQKINKTAVATISLRFAVILTQDNQANETYIPETWLDPDMFHSFIGFYMDIVNNSFSKDYCYVSGEYVPITDKHSNGIRTNSDFAKIISSNENGLIVYSGDKFHTASEAVSIGYVTSLKAHSALKWLISNQGIKNQGNITVAWHEQGTPIKIPYNVDTATAFGEDAYKSFSSSNEYLSNLSAITKKTVNNQENYGLIHFLELDSSFKADMKGRIAILDYNVYKNEEFYQNILGWHQKYFWNLHMGKRHFTGAPSVKDIVLAAFGVQGSNKTLTVNTKSLYTMQYNRILKCILWGRSIPEDIIRQLYNHANTPLKYSHTFDMILSIACAAINGKKNGGDFILDKTCSNRDYLFGRLLAIANFAEKLTFKQGENGRVTNAARYTSQFVIKPAATWKLINQRLQPYLKKLNRSNKRGEEYHRLVNTVVDMFNPDDFSNKKLGYDYLLGYSSQSTALSKREYARSNNTTNTTANNDK